MELSKLKVGQVVEHDNGFIGEIESIDASTGRYTDVNIRVIDSGDSFNEVGSVWCAMPEYINRIVRDVPTLPVFPEKVTVEAELEFTGLDKLEELIGQAEEALEILNDTKTIKVSVQGIEFEGTTVQFESFMATMTKYLGNL